MTTSDEFVIGWFIITVMTVGFLLAYLRARRWYNSRTWDDVMRMR